MRIASHEWQCYRCSLCGELKPTNAFSFSSEQRRSLNSYCRACHAAYRHTHYLAHKADYVRRAAAQVKRRRAANRREVLAYLSNHPCIGCGIADPVVLEFDHRDPRQKLGDIGTMVLTKPWTRVRAEIEKCDVRCVNCHRRKTAREFRWKKHVRLVE